MKIFRRFVFPTNRLDESAQKKNRIITNTGKSIFNERIPLNKEEADMVS